MSATTPPPDAGSILTIGHSTHAVDTFIARLAAHSITALIDVRRFPGSRRHPQFGRDALAASLADADIRYTHVEGLGGRRTPRPDSINTVWRTHGFRGYADHMASADFVHAFDAVARDAGSARSVLMCAEGLWWQCHRSLIADNFVLHGWRVSHILPNGSVAPHAFREPARLLGDVAVYDHAQASLL